MKAIVQRIADWRRERRIQRLRIRVCGLFETQQMNAARGVMRELTAEINARSPEQVARMERARGLTHA